MESAIEFRNVVELDAWLAGDSIGKLSISDLARSVSPQPAQLVGQKRGTDVDVSKSNKRKDSTDGLFFGQMRSFFSTRLPSLSSIFPGFTQKPAHTEDSLYLLPIAAPSVKFTQDFIDILPYEILLHVFLFLNAHDIHTCSRVCHRWWQVTNCDEIWQKVVTCEVVVGLERKSWEKYVEVSAEDVPLSPRSQAKNAESEQLPMVLSKEEARFPSSDSDIAVGALTNSVLRNGPDLSRKASGTTRLRRTTHRKEELKALFSKIQEYAR